MRRFGFYSAVVLGLAVASPGVSFGSIQSIETSGSIEGEYARILFGTLYCEGDATAEFDSNGFIESRCGYTDQFTSGTVEAHLTEGESASLDIASAEYFSGIGAVAKGFSAIGSRGLLVEKVGARKVVYSVAQNPEIFIACEREVSGEFRCAFSY